jgi:hypothetical protein
VVAARAELADQLADHIALVSVGRRHQDLLSTKIFST